MDDVTQKPLMIFKTTKGYRIFSYVMLALAIALCAGGPAVWIILCPGLSMAQVVVFVAGIGLAAFAAWGITVVPRNQIEIWPDFIRQQGVWSARELRFADIKGFRVFSGKSARLCFIPKDFKSHKGLSLAFNYERKSELLQWANAHLVDLDKDDYESDLAEIKSNVKLGSSVEQRLAKLASAKRWTQALSVIAFASCMWALVYPRPYEFVIGWLALLPGLTFVLMGWSRGLIRMDAKAKGAYSNPILGFIMPTMLLALRALEDWHILDWSGFWTPFLLLGSCITVVLFNLVPAIRKKISTLIFATCLVFFYSFGLIIPLNCYFDRSQPTAYVAKVFNERVVRGKSTTYYMTLSPFTDTILMREVSVSSSFYRRNPVGNTIHVYVRKGYLGISWFHLR